MTEPSVFPRLDESDMPIEDLGGKAGALRTLSSHDFRIPPGFVVTADAVTALGDQLDAALQNAANEIGPGPFAVRSSAASEDLAEASYAGMYETYLNVDPADLAEAVRRGFNAVSSQRVAAYDIPRRTLSPQDHALSGMAMLVQQMVPAVAAGVAFTANPLTGQRDETIVTAVRGLGESLVSGDSVGEQWTIHAGHANRTRVGEGAITERQALEVADLARRVESHFGTPQDIEWAIDDDRNLFLLQARPMTAVPDPVEWLAPGPGLWSRNFRLGEWLPEAMTPLFADWLLPRIESGYLDGMRADARVNVPFRYASVNGWYYNATPVPSPRLLWRALADSRGRAIWFLYNALVRVSRNPVAAHRALLNRMEVKWREVLLPAYRTLVDRGDRDLEAANLDRVVEMVDEFGRRAGEYLWSLAVVGGSAWKMEGALTRFWRKHLAPALAGTSPGTRGPQLLLRGLPGAQPSLPPHAVYSLDWYHPTVGEAPGGDDNAAALSDSQQTELVIQDRIACEQACRTALRNEPNLLARFDQLLTVAQHYAVLREEQARDLSLAWPVLRRCASLLGERLRRAGAIDDDDDVYFLTLDEVLDNSADRRHQVQERRATWERQRHLSAPVTLGSPPRLIGDPIAHAVAAARSTNDAPPDAIIGHPASIGRATGRVRIITSPTDFASFLPGEVLVTKATAPAWTPLFARAVAVVTDGGTLAAHASLVAREYGIPAVVGTGDATTRLHTGMLVRVDGGAGTVIPLHATVSADGRSATASD